MLLLLFLFYGTEETDTERMLGDIHIPRTTSYLVVVLELKILIGLRVHTINYLIHYSQDHILYFLLKLLGFLDN